MPIALLPVSLEARQKVEPPALQLASQHRCRSRPSPRRSSAAATAATKAARQYAPYRQNLLKRRWKTTTIAKATKSKSSWQYFVCCCGLCSAHIPLTTHVIVHQPHVGDGTIFQETSSSSEILRGISYETQHIIHPICSFIFGHQFGYVWIKKPRTRQDTKVFTFHLRFTRECEDMARILRAQIIQFEFKTQSSGLK